MVLHPQDQIQQVQADPPIQRQRPAFTGELTRGECLIVAAVLILTLVPCVALAYWAAVRRLKGFGFYRRVSRKALVQRKVIREIVLPNLRVHVREWMDSADRVTEVVGLIPHGGTWLTIRTPRWNILTPPAGIPVPSTPAFIATTSDPVWARALLTPQWWSELQRLSDAYYETLFVDLRPGQFVIRVREPENAPPMTEMLIEFAIRFAEQALAVPGTASAGSVQAQMARCGVCGTSVAPVRQFVCSSCQTPHHRECWNDNEGCATYGCGTSSSTN